MKLKALLFVALLLVGARSASAQVTTSYTLVISSGAAVVSTTVIPAAAFLCNQTPLPAGVTTNARHIQFTDPANAAMACIYLDPGTGPLAALPFGATSYTGTLLATDSAGSSAPSVASPPFSETGQVPPVLTGVVIFR